MRDGMMSWWWVMLLGLSVERTGLDVCNVGSRLMKAGSRK